MSAAPKPPSPPAALRLVARSAARPAVELGDEDPLYTRNVSSGPPDRRRVSLRWLSGSVLTGIFSAGLVGGALQAAMGDYAIVRPAVAHGSTPLDTGAVLKKGDRFRPPAESKLTRRVIQISTVTRSQDRDIVRVRPFAHVDSGLVGPVAADVQAQIPIFNSAVVYADTGADTGGDGRKKVAAADVGDEAGSAGLDGGDRTGSDGPAVASDGASDSIYGAEVDGEVSIKVADFPVGSGDYERTAEMTDGEAEESVRKASAFLTDGAVNVASLAYIDPARFEAPSDDLTGLGALAVAITPENISLVAKDATPEESGISERVLPVSRGDSLRKMLQAQGASVEDATQIQSTLLANYSFDFRAGQTLRIGVSSTADGLPRPVRVSLYDGPEHLGTVALSDSKTFVPAKPPVLDADGLAANIASQPVIGGALPTLHAGLWGTGLTLGMSKDLIASLVHIFSYDVDYQSRLSPTDALEVIYSAGGEGETEGSEILFASLTVGGAAHRFYRFRDPGDGSVDYYDPDGKSAQKFLVRKPVAQGRFSSAFGMRRHPILKRYRLHSGVDWAAPIGTPILAAGNGVIDTIGTRSGYGRSITLRHLNGYETTYNHMSGYAKSLKRGQRIRQGQVIGFVGSSGLSTGPHLHFEVLVNNRFVDPMKIRLPRGRELQGTELASFEAERQRIDDLITRDDNRLAAAGGSPIQTD